MKADTLADALAKGRGVERPFRCEVHDDSNASASVNVMTGLWCCYACGAAGKLDGDYTVPDPDTLLRMLKGETPPRVFAEAWLDAFDMHHASKYWSMRFGEDTATYFRCGTHPLTGNPTYPIRDAQGRVLGVVTRQDRNPKYLYPLGVPTSQTFFGDLRPNPVVVLVEGAADVMALHQSGIPDNWTVLGCFGAGVHAPQARLITDLAPNLIVAAFDNDAAGQDASERARHQLGGIAPVVIHSWETVNDPGDLDVQFRVQVIENTIAKENV